MNFFVKYLLLCIFIFLLTNNTFGQVAAFTQDTLEGCGQQTVNFINQSTGATSYLWRFGDGNTSTSSGNVTENYVNAGTYTVTLVAINGSSRDSISKIINIWRNPDAVFYGTQPLQGCIPLTVNFTDVSIAGDGTINSWTWDFGDGSGASTQNPSHSFTTPGSWSIYMKVEDSHHCIDWDTLNNYVNVTNPPDVSFIANQTVNCTVPFPVTFSNTSTGTAPMTYAWDFGDGGNSTQQSPNHIYTVAGTYTVKLTVWDKWGCVDSLIKISYISITPVTAAFHTVPADSACPGQTVNFFNDAGTTVSWNFGDPTSSSNTSGLSNPTHSYMQPGQYIITMVAAPGTLCQSIIKDTIIIRNRPTVLFDISPNPHYVCSNTMPVNFTDNSPDAVSWFWNVGDNITSTLENPIITYPNEGVYPVTLTITDSHGCVGTSIHADSVTVDFPSASINWDSDSLPNHCIPFPVDFTGTGSCNLIYDNIPATGWSWDFGDGATSNLQNPNHIYTTPGEYTISLTVTTASGCTATATVTIKVGSHQIPIIQNTYSLGCANDTNVHFVSLSTDSNLIDFWDWTFISHFDTDSTFDVATSSEQHPTVDFHGNDSISIQLIVGYLECKDTLVDTNAFQLNGPYLRGIDTIFSCATPLHVGFTYDFIKQANRWYWDFNGDGAYDDSSNFPTPVYSYNDTVWYDFPSRGTYVVHLKAYNDVTGCFYEDSMSYRIFVIDAIVSAPTPHCYNSNVITITNSLDWLHYGPFPQNADYTINYGDGQTTPYTTFNESNQVYLHNYPMVNGTYNVILTMHNFLGCIDRDTTTIRIYYPVAGYTMTPDSGCAPLIVNFTDTSYSEIPYTSTWFSGGIGSTTGSTATFTYNIPNTYMTSLVVTDSIGCTSTVAGHPVFVLNIPPDFSAIDSTICLGDSVHFISNALFSNGYTWDFGDLNTDINLNPSHLYSDTGTYTVSLLTQSTLPGCSGSEIKPSFIHVQSIATDINVIDAVSTCYPFSINITNLTNTMYNPMWDWSFGDGLSGNQFEPIHTYTLPGDYWLHLTSTTTPQNLFGCVSSDSVLIHVGGPYAEISYTDSTICKGESITFALIDSVTVGVTSFNWSFGDGGGGSTTPFTYQFNYVPPTGLTKVYLIYQSDVNCQKKDSVYINIYQVMANFNYLNSITGSNDSVICQPGLLDFYNYSIGADSMIWSFGDGQSFTSTDSSIVPGTHTFYNQTNNNINYNITLTVYNSAVGCIDSITKHYLVYPLPQINVGNDVAICVGSSIQLNATGGNVISWTPANGLSNQASYNPFATPDSSVMYQALIHDAHGCSNTDSVFVFVQQIPDLNHNPDTTIIIGEYVDMMANSDQTSVTYNWTPSYGLSCTTCPNPVAQPLTTTTYTVEIIDSMTCFHVSSQVTIEVKEEYSIDVPSAFTPNGDGDNDLVFVRGWGIKQLLEFKIYNRWGECIFETDDMHVGWDGTFKGNKQNIDTYAYTAKAATYSGKVLTKNGLVNLLR